MRLLAEQLPVCVDNAAPIRVEVWPKWICRMIGETDTWTIVKPVEYYSLC